MNQTKPKPRGGRDAALAFGTVLRDCLQAWTRRRVGFQASSSSTCSILCLRYLQDVPVLYIETSLVAQTHVSRALALFHVSRTTVPCASGVAALSFFCACFVALSHPIIRIYLSIYISIYLSICSCRNSEALLLSQVGRTPMLLGWACFVSCQSRTPIPVLSFSRGHSLCSSPMLLPSCCCLFLLL